MLLTHPTTEDTMEQTYAQAMAEAQSYRYRAALAASFGDYQTRDALEAKAAELTAYADNLEGSY